MQKHHLDMINEDINFTRTAAQLIRSECRRVSVIQRDGGIFFIACSDAQNKSTGIARHGRFLQTGFRTRSEDALHGQTCLLTSFCHCDLMYRLFNNVQLPSSGPSSQGVSTAEH